MLTLLTLDDTSYKCEQFSVAFSVGSSQKLFFLLFFFLTECWLIFWGRVVILIDQDCKAVSRVREGVVIQRFLYSEVDRWTFFQSYLRWGRNRKVGTRRLHCTDRMKIDI